MRKLASLILFTVLVISVLAYNGLGFVLNDVLQGPQYPFNQATFQCSSTLFGDYNNDGQRNFTDTQILLHSINTPAVVINGSVNGILCDPLTLDVNLDGVVNIADANLYQGYVVSGFPQCGDGIDNDNDTLIDFPTDLGCTSFIDLTESITTKTYAPQFTIVNPLNNTNIANGTSVTLRASTFDLDEPGNAVPSQNIQWTSSLQGVLGNGTTLNIILTLGTHILTVQATDSTGLSSTATIQVSVINPFTVTASASPASGSTPLNSVTTCTANQGSAPYRFSIYYSDAGTISFVAQNSNVLTHNRTYYNPGTVTVTCHAVDNTGNTVSGSTQVTVTGTSIVNNAPDVNITTPTNNSQFTQGNSVTFTAVSYDVEDGTLQSSNMLWASNIDGIIGTGHSFSTSSLSLGTHAIVVIGTDRGARSATDTITLTITNGSVSIPQGPFVISVVLLGGPNQEVASNITATLTITNNGNAVLNNIVLNGTASATYNVQFQNVPATLAPGQSATVTVTGTMPSSFDAVNAQCEPAAILIGTLTATAFDGTQTLSTTSNLSMQRKNHLEFEDVQIEVEGSDEDLDNGDEIDMKPGDDVTITINAENSFDENREDLSLEDIEARLIVDDSFDIDEDVEFDDLDAEEENTQSISFNVEEDTDKGTYDVDIRLCGRVENNRGRMGERIQAKFNVEREDDDVIIKSLDLDKDKVQCGEAVRLSVLLENVGDNDEDDAAILLENDDLSVNDKIDSLEIDEDDGITERFTFKVPSNARTGSYTLNVNAYNDENDITDSQTIDLSVECGGSSTSERTTTERSQDGQPTLNNGNIQPPVVSGDRIYAEDTTKTGFRTSNFYLPFLILVTLVVALLIVLAVRSLRK